MTATSLLDGRLSDQFAREFPELAIPWRAAEAPQPELLVLNAPLARELGLDPAQLRGAEGVRMLVGVVPAEGSHPVVQVYAGHQFGGYSPRLGDGRALLLGEVTDASGGLCDLHLKGSGRTPLARADGFAVIGPMLREYLVSEAMHAMGVPTTRALAVVATGRTVRREAELMPGAVLVRVASSHLRVGSFEFARYTGDRGLLRRLADHAIARHYPGLAEAAFPVRGLLAAVIDAQASLTAAWMLRGFVHGVMNTDNVTISGETIDYGPCAFLDRYDEAAVFSSIDVRGRYAYGRQPAITRWNLERFAESLLPILGDTSEDAVAVARAELERFDGLYRGYWVEGMRAKLGLDRAAVDNAELAVLAERLLSILQDLRLDFTTFFRALAGVARGDREPLGALLAREAGAGNADPAAAEPSMLIDPLLEKWLHEWLAWKPDGDAMDRVNPLYIPRNHLVDSALNAANTGDLEPFTHLLDAVSRPFEARPGLAAYALPAPPDAPPHRTYCGT